MTHIIVSQLGYGKNNGKADRERKRKRVGTELMPVLMALWKIDLVKLT